MTRSPDEITIYDTDLTLREAANLARVDPETIRTWRRRGHLPVHHRTARGYARYSALDVAKAEAKTARHVGVKRPA